MKTPPEYAVRTLRRISSAGDRAEIEGDLHEAFLAWVEARGVSFARRRYWREVAMLAGWKVLGAGRRVADHYRNQRGADPASASPGSPHGGKPDKGKGRSSGSSGDLLIDIRYGIRRLAKNPFSSAVAILLLAVGVGGNAMVYTVVDEVLVEPPPLIEAPKELVGLDWRLGRGTGVDFGYYDYEFYRDEGDAFSDVLAYGGFPGLRGRRIDGGGGEVLVGQGEDVDQAGAWVVSGNYFRVLGVPMGLGAGFSAEVQAHARLQTEVVLSFGYWTRALGQDPSVLHEPIYLNGVAFRVAGITHPDFKGVNPGEPVPDLFVPILSADAISPGFADALLRFHPDGSPSASRFLRLVARLEPGLALEAAQAEAAILQGTWEAEFSDWASVVYGEPHQVSLRSEFGMAPFESRLLRRQLYFLWFVVGAVFLIGCTNLAILLLASVSGREREMGIRASLGAGRKRLLSQLVTESLVLSVLGGVAGLGLAYLAGGAVTATLSMNFETSFTPDGSVALFALLLSSVAAVLFGTAPAWRLSRVDVTTLIQRPGQARTRAHFRGGLVVVQTALSILLLIGGGLLARSVQGLGQIDLGWDPEGRMILGVDLEAAGYDEEEGQALVSAILDRIALVPGVSSASTCNRIPFLGSNTWRFTAPGTDFTEEGMQTNFNLAGPGHFEAMGIPLLAGRAFTRDDAAGSPIVAIVNEVFANRLWPGETPIGKTLGFADQTVQVVGLAKTAVYSSPTEAPQPYVYLASLQWYQGRQNFIVAAETAGGSTVRTVEQAMRELDASLRISSLSLEELVKSQSESYRIWTALIGVFAGIALFLALVGLYGVQSYLVSRRTREIGIRVALGEETRSVLMGVMRSGLLMGGIGAAVGVSAAFALTRLMRGFLVGVAPNDPLVFFTVPAILLLACAAASLIPALRAARTNPVEALAQE